MTYYDIPKDYATIAQAMGGAVDGDTFNVASRYTGNETVSVTADNTRFYFESLAPNVTMTLASYVFNISISGEAEIAVIGNDGNNTIRGASSSNAGRGTDYIDGTRGDDVFTFDIDGSDAVYGNTGNNTYILSGTRGLGGNIYGGRAEGDVDKVVASHLGKLSLADVEELDTKDVTATIKQLSAFSTIGDTTADETVITVRLQGAGGQINFSGSVRGGDSVRILDAGLTSRVTLTGTDDADRLGGSVYDDLLSGRDGDDRYVVNNARDVVVESDDQGTDSVEASVSFTLSAHVENLTLTGRGNIAATGNAADNILTGNVSNNVIDGGEGADAMKGLKGNDTYVVDSTGDRVVEASGEGVDTVRSSIDYALGANLENLTLIGSAAIDGVGNAVANVLTGNASINVLAGKQGNDVYVVQNGDDTVREAANEGVDEVRSSVSFKLSANVERLVLTGTAAINGEGNQLANNLVGNAGNNVLNGGAGQDILEGKGGADTFLFRVAASPESLDHIRDFDTADRIGLDDAVFKGLKVGTLGSAAFKDLAKGSVDANDRILYDQKTGSLYFDADGSGSGQRLKIAILDNHAALTFDDILIV